MGARAGEDERRLRCPYCGKVRFSTEREAKAELEHITQRSAAGDHRRRERRAYPCLDGCGDWHLTSQEVPWEREPRRDGGPGRGRRRDRGPGRGRRRAPSRRRGRRPRMRR
ncbi:MAG TPA: hypothetical protein VNP94_00210 [Actinomycetota bacterium]|nr:hypothetical protein [Actinomycetota bacterium]